MKIIEALKKTKDLQRKAEDLRNLVKDHCAISSLETSKYPDQKGQVSKWIQAHSDILKEILDLRIAIQRTNLMTEATIVLDGKNVTKTIAEWIHRRRDLANAELQMWNILGDRGVQEGIAKGPSGDAVEIKICRFYEPIERDHKRDVYVGEPSTIDARLEVVNAVTDLIQS